MNRGTSVASLRRRADKLGYAFRKSNWRRDSIDNLGGYQLVDVQSNLVVDGARYDLELSAVADWIEHFEKVAQALDNGGYVSTPLGREVPGLEGRGSGQGQVARGVRMKVAEDRFKILADAYIQAAERCETADEIEYAVRAALPDATEEELLAVFETYNDLSEVQVRLALSTVKPAGNS